MADNNAKLAQIIGRLDSLERRVDMYYMDEPRLRKFIIRTLNDYNTEQKEVNGEKYKCRRCRDGDARESVRKLFERCLWRMSEQVRRWSAAIQTFLLDTVRLQHACSVPYLMVVNFLFCFISFYVTREAQLRSLYALIGFIFCCDLLFAKRQNNFAVELLRWIFCDFLRSTSVALCVYSANELHEDREGGERHAFWSSLVAVCLVVISPVYAHRKVNAKIAQLARRFAGRLKQLLADYVIYPLMVIFEWTKYLLLLRWLPLLGASLRSCALSIWDWLDSLLFSPIRTFTRRLRSLFIYVFCLHWCRDLWKLAKRAFIDPAITQLSRLLDAFIYVFGCYWLKPLLKRAGRFTLDLASIGLRHLGQASLAMAALLYEHVACPLLLLCGDRIEQLARHLYAVAVRPALAACYRKYKTVEDLVLIHLLGPVCQKLIEALPERSPFALDSDTELDEFIPETGAEEAEGQMESEQERAEHDSAMHSEEEEDNDVDELLSLHSLDGEKALASGLKHIAISDSDSETDEFLPVARRRKVR